MKRIFSVELKNIFSSLMLIGYFLIPIMIFYSMMMIFSVGIGMSSSIFVQVLFISFFYFGLRVRNYKNNSIERKIKNSKINMHKVNASLFLVSTIIIFLTIIPVVILGFVYSDGIGHIDKVMQSNDFTQMGTLNQNETDKIFFLYTKDGVSGYLTFGTINEYLILMHGSAQIFQFIFSVMIMIVVSTMMSLFISNNIGTDSIYISISIISFSLIIIFSNLFFRELMLMEEGQYTRNQHDVRNEFISSVEYFNPFFWINQLLMNTIYSNANLGTWDGNIIDASHATLSYSIPIFSIFHVGTTVGDSQVYNMIPFTDNIEFLQLGQTIIPSIWIVVLVISVVLTERGGDSKWTK